MRASLLLSASLRLDRIFSPRLIANAFAGDALATRLGLSFLLREFDKVRSAVTGPAALALFDAPWILIYVAVCFVLHPAIGALARASAFLLLLLAIWNERATHRLNAHTAPASAECAQLQDSLGRAGDTVRALGMSGALQARLLASRNAASLSAVQAARINGSISGTTRFLRLLLQSTALALGAWLAILHQISGGAIFAASMLAGRALAPIDAIVAQWRVLSQAAAAYRLIGAEAISPANDVRTQLPPPRGRLAVQNLAVAAPGGDRLLLSEVSFASEGAEIIGVIGASGAGKTTLLQALASARPALQGELRLDGARYQDWSPERLGRAFGYLPQDSVLFPGTVADNISRFDRVLGLDPAWVGEKMLTAARRAGVHDLILRLPCGYDTLLGPGGEGLSAGQRQRIALARALYDDPCVCLLDEPNANLDSEGEAQLVQTLLDLRARGALVIVSVHRLPLAAIADRLMVLKGGRLERLGPRQAVLEGLKGPAVRQPGRSNQSFTSSYETAPVAGAVQITKGMGA